MVWGKRCRLPKTSIKEKKIKYGHLVKEMAKLCWSYMDESFTITHILNYRQQLL